ncbi:regulator of nonsense transcripts UPF3 isoform X2 [Cryptomeria japonica]|uniref:regulator of nonsense transcripts UPF3 isoform X2 n=1 Tax=Cryptomeria japonica TaxID=3369 RepID=UPI0025AB9C53|nr:regulator of nonsense transcripts UPF3 isoform X2 [Cryptomeria japonica]
MKDQGSATKLVLRRLPPALSEAALRAQIESRFSGRYNWLVFRPAHTSLIHSHSQRHQLFSRAYIQMKTPIDVFEFADVFNGHVFVDEKGTQCTSKVEYAPYQGVPDTSKKDPREGTIDKDPKYLEFLEMIAKPVENLPSAEIQLDRKEAERPGAQKDDMVVTPLMEYVRQKRAAKSGLRLSSSGRKSGGRPRGAASTGLINKRGIERGKMNNVAYVMRDSTRGSSNKEKPTCILVQQRDQQQCCINEISIEKSRKDVDGKDRHNCSEGIETREEEGSNSVKSMQEPTDEMASVGDCSGESGKRRLLLSKDREKEFANGPSGGLSVPNSMDVGVQVHKRQTSNFKGSSAQQTGGPSNLQGVMSPVKGASGSMNFKHNHRWESNGRVGRGTLSSQDVHISVMSTNLEQQNQVLPNAEKDKRPPRHPGLRSSLKDHSFASSSVDVDVKNFQDEKNMYATSKELYSPICMAEKQDRRTRNKDRPDRPVWTPRRRSDGPPGSDAAQHLQAVPEGALKIEKTDKGLSRQKVALVEKVTEDTFLQVDNSSDSFVAVPGKSSYVDLGGPQSSRRANTHLGVVASLDINQVDPKIENILSSGGGDIEGQNISRTAVLTGENGNHRQILRRPSASVTREADGASALEMKQNKRGAAVGYGGQEGAKSKNLI